jgi:hypothetical protein
MKLILIMTHRNPACENTQTIWHETCLKHNIELDVLDFENKKGKNLAKKLNLNSLPALIDNNNIIAVGQPDIKTAEKIIIKLTTKR